MTTLTLTDIEREALAGAIHEALRCNCDSGEADRMVADSLAPTLEEIFAGRTAPRCEAGDCDRPVAPGLIPLCVEHRAEFKAWREQKP